MEKTRPVTKKVWISVEKVIARNSQEETYNELYGSGYIAKLNAAIAMREKRLIEEEMAKKERARQRALAKARREAKAQEEEPEC